MIIKKEDKELLLKDLCARLFNGVKLDTPDGVDTLGNVDINEGWINASYDVDEIKPYLRSLSSMTEEERKELISIRPYFVNENNIVIGVQCNSFTQISECQDWLNRKMFDYRTDDEGKTMIEKGLALEAPKGMYNF